MSGEQDGALFEPACGQQFVHLTMNGNEAGGVVVDAVHQHHAHAQLAHGFLVKGFEALVLVETNEHGVEVKVGSDGANEITSANGFFVVVDGGFEFGEARGVGLAGGGDGGEFEHAADLVDLVDIFEGELGDRETAMQVAAEQALETEDANGFAHGVARDAEGGGELEFLQGGAGAELAGENLLANDGGYLISHADAVDLGTLHDGFPHKQGGYFLRGVSICQVLKS